MKFMIARGLMAASLAICVATPSNAAKITGLFNTGVDNSGNVLTSGVDAHYVLNGSSSPALYNNGLYVQASDATWIAANSTGGYTVNPNIYTLTFSLADLNPATASLSGRFASDNIGTVSLNGILLATSPSFGSFTNFSANSGFLASNNVLSFAITDLGPPSAFIVSGLTGTADASVGAVPEPATWAMMLVGFGGVGFAMRRRKSKVITNVAFA